MEGNVKNKYNRIEHFTCLVCDRVCKVEISSPFPIESTYNLCMDCMEDSEKYNLYTPEIYTEYGLMEVKESE